MYCMYFVSIDVCELNFLIAELANSEEHDLGIVGNSRICGMDLYASVVVSVGPLLRGIGISRICGLFALYVRTHTWEEH